MDGVQATGLGPWGGYGFEYEKTRPEPGRCHFYMNLGGEPTTRRRNPQTQARIEPTNVCNPQAKVVFRSVSLFFICIEQELESLILKFHWKSFPTDLVFTRNRFLHPRVAIVNLSILDSKC